MAIVTIFVEGGVLEGQNISVQTLADTQVLREGFYKLLTQKFNGEDFQLNIEMSSNVNQTMKFFKDSFRDKKQNVLAIIDLDTSPNNRNQRLVELDVDGAMGNNIIFMVQEMEAWILSQPDKIDECYQHLKRKKKYTPLSEDEILQNKSPESITKPSKKLHTLLKRYFYIEKRGKEKKKDYKKLKDGGNLLLMLDYKKLEEVFSDVKRLSDILEQHIESEK